MPSSQIKQFLIDKMTILDWYDGVVRAIVSMQGQSYLLVLVAWDAGSLQKAFILAELSLPFAAKIERLVLEASDESVKRERWAKFNNLLEKYISDYQGEVYLTGEEPIRGKNISASTISTEHLRRVRGQSIESADSSEARDFWFTLLSSCNPHNQD